MLIMLRCPGRRHFPKRTQGAAALAWAAASRTVWSTTCSSRPWSALPFNCSLRDFGAALQEDAAWHAFIEPVWEVSAVFMMLPACTWANAAAPALSK